MAEETNLNELVTSYRQNLEFSKKDDELIIAIGQAIKESLELKITIDKRGEINKIYWEKGTIKDLSKLHIKKSRAGVNRIFTDMETAIPILSANTPESTVVGNFDNNARENIQDGLTIAYEVNYKMQTKLQCLLRHWFIYLIGVIKYRWDIDKGFITENVLPKKLGIDKRATTKENCEYIWEEMEDTAEYLITRFPTKEKDITDIAGKDNLKTKIKYFEFWGGNGKWVCWIIPGKNLILSKKKNPNFDYTDETKNIFQSPQFPYLFLSVFNLGDNNSLYDNVSLIEEAASAQEGVNDLERQIIDLNEGQKRVWVASGEAMSERKAQDLVTKTGDLMVYLDRKAPVGALTQVQSGKPDSSLFNNLTHLLSEIDNIFGIHSTTRGERNQQETFGGRQLLMASDIGRMDMIVRNVEQVVEEWYNAYLHMIKVYSIEPISFISAEKSVEIKPEEIPNDVMVMVKKGSTLPTDDKTKMEMAQALAQSGMIDPKTLFEEMGYSNSDQRTQDLYQWLSLTGKIQPQQPQMGVEQGMEGQQAGDQEKMQQVQRLRQIMEQSKQLPPDQQGEVAGKVAEIANQMGGQ